MLKKKFTDKLHICDDLKWTIKHNGQFLLNVLADLCGWFDKSLKSDPSKQSKMIIVSYACCLMSM